MNHTEGKFLFKPNNGDPRSYEELGDPLQAIQAAGLLPSGTLFQLLAPTDTSVFWGDISSNPHVLKRHNGTAWVAATFEDVYVREPQEEIITTSANFTVPEGVNRLWGHCRGAGGGGGGGSANEPFHGQVQVGGAGGGRGGLAFGWFDVTPNEIIAIQIGLGGTGSLYSTTTVNLGQGGGNSAIGTHLTATGGGGGGATRPGNGGIGFGGTVEKGDHGGFPYWRGNVGTFWGGKGGGNRTQQLIGSVDGEDAPANTGGGGSGASRINNATATRGGDGADGVVILRWFE